MELLDRTALAALIEQEGLADTASSIPGTPVAEARSAAWNVADTVERFGYGDGQTAYLAHELRRWGNLTR